LSQWGFSVPPFHINHLTERVGIDFAFPTSKEFGG
jgi:hypothetical protein